MTEEDLYLGTAFHLAHIRAQKNVVTAAVKQRRRIQSQQESETTSHRKNAQRIVAL